MKKYQEIKQDFWNGNFIRLIEHLVDVFILGLTFLFIAEFNNYQESGEFISIIELFKVHESDIFVTVLYLIVAAFFFMVYQVTITRSRFYKVIVTLFLSLVFTNVVLIIIAFINIDQFIIGNPLDVLFIFITQIIVFSFIKFFEYYIYNKFGKKIKVAVIGPEKQAIELSKNF